MCGNGGTSYATQPERVVGLEGVFIADVAAGGWHSMAISAEGGGWGPAGVRGGGGGGVLGAGQQRLCGVGAS